MAVVKGPLNYINGQRVESSNKNAEDDMNVIEPATGCLYSTALLYFQCQNYILSGKTTNSTSNFM